MLYKNWPEICKLARINPPLSLGLATLNLSTPEGQAIADALPAYFADSEVHGPIPKSVIEQEMLRTSGELWDLAECARKFDVPTIEFCTPHTEPHLITKECIMVTNEQMDAWTSPGGKNEEWKIIEWRGQKLIVLFDYPPEKITATPLECIDLKA